MSVEKQFVEKLKKIYEKYVIQKMWLAVARLVWLGKILARARSNNLVRSRFHNLPLALSRSRFRSQV